MRRVCVALSAWCLLTTGLAGQGTPATPALPEPGSELEVYLMTMGPGDLIWERFGHNGLGIRDRSTGSDVVYNWGVFRFSEADFLPRFLRGEMRYSVEPYDAGPTLAAYQQVNRSVWIQDLNLTPAQRIKVRDYVEWNARVENKFYRYDYFGDNCSTRVRDVLDRALGGALTRQFTPVSSGNTFRDEARRLTDMDVLYTGIDIGLGSPSDRMMNRFEALFIPMRLQEALREVQVMGPDGTPRPIVTAERELFKATRAEDLPAAPNHQLRYLLIGALLAAVLWWSGRGTGGARFLSLTWAVVAGIFGLLLVGLWGFTRHVWAYENINLLFFNPLWFLLAAVVARRHVPGTAGQRLILLLGMLSVVGLVLGLVRTPQAAEQVALLAALPNLAVLLAMWQRRPA